jgi:hypothetical protein
VAKFLVKFLQPPNKSKHPKLGQNFCQKFLQSQAQMKHSKLGQFLKDNDGGFPKVAYHFNIPSGIIFPSGVIFLSKIFSLPQES